MKASSADAADEWAGIVGRDQPVARLQAAMRRSCARRCAIQLREVRRRQRDVARRAGRAAGGEDAHDRRAIGAARCVPIGSASLRVARSSSFSVKGSLAISSSPPTSAAFAKPGRRKFLAIESRMREADRRSAGDRARRRQAAARPMAGSRHRGRGSLETCQAFAASCARRPFTTCRSAALARKRPRRRARPWQCATRRFGCRRPWSGAPAHAAGSRASRS